MEAQGDATVAISIHLLDGVFRHPWIFWVEMSPKIRQGFWANDILVKVVPVLGVHGGQELVRQQDGRWEGGPLA